MVSVLLAMNLIFQYWAHEQASLSAGYEPLPFFDWYLRTRYGWLR